MIAAIFAIPGMRDDKEIVKQYLEHYKTRKSEEEPLKFFKIFFQALKQKNFVVYIALFLGYKISNHVCLCYFLREHLGREDLSRVFDDLRFKRNMLVYYGKRMEFSIALEAINHSKMLFSQLTNIFRKLKNRYSK
ncbi:hypothetical protein DRJ16_06655 [Candidatus Woesearchaeota archaeon]|nr:MAG: hypothetical protein DRJ16_06655 [Candidatus Woesearchaeota archaeon]